MTRNTRPTIQMRLSDLQLLLDVCEAPETRRPTVRMEAVSVPAEIEAAVDALWDAA